MSIKYIFLVYFQKNLKKNGIIHSHRISNSRINISFFFCTSSDVLSAYSHLNVPIKASINLSLCRVSTIFYASFQNVLFVSISIQSSCVNCSIIYRLIFNSKNLFEEYLKFKIKRIILRTILSILKFQIFIEKFNLMNDIMLRIWMLEKVF